MNYDQTPREKVIVRIRELNSKISKLTVEMALLNKELEDCYYNLNYQEDLK